MSKIIKENPKYKKELNQFSVMTMELELSRIL